MGSVYEAQDSHTGARVALKLIQGELTEDALGRFQREVRAAQVIDTPHIVRVLDAGTDPDSGLPFMVMEYLEGEDIMQLLKRLGPLPPDLALRIVAQACLGLEAAHQHRIVHRDMKPANLFLTRGSARERIVKVLDFGVAKIKMDQASHEATAGLTRTGSMLGSPLYMSPEQARGHKGIDHRADIWSMGIVLYKLLTGRTPHQDIDTLGELIITICSQLPAPVQDLAPWVPAEVAAILHGAVRFDPAERFQSAAHVLHAVRPLLPYGFGITDEMLRPLSDPERAYVAPRLMQAPDMSPLRASVAPIPSMEGSRNGPSGGSGSGNFPPQAPGMGAPGGYYPGSPSQPPIPPPSSSGLGWAPGAPVPPVSGTFSPTSSGAVQSAPAGSAAPPRSPMKAILAAGAFVALAAGGLGAYALLRPASSVGPQPASPAPALEPSSAPNALAPTPQAKERSVKVVIIPDDAAVEIEGAPASVTDGLVEIRGALGSVHKVRVGTGDSAVTRDVVVTENGAIPPKIELAKPAVTPSGLPTAPTAPTAPTGPRPMKTSQPPPLDLRIQR